VTAPFTYAALPSKVVFGFGTLASVPDEVRALSCVRAIVLSTPEQKDSAQALAERLGASCVGVFAQAAMHTPIDITERAIKFVRDRGADCTVAIGGGSTTGLGKAIALRTDLPQIVLPTTYAGSEATPVVGETQDGKKTTQRSMKVLPEVIIYDVDLTLTLPTSLSATSGMNAIAHAVEALYPQNANPVISMLAERGIEAMSRALPPIMKNPTDKAARSEALLGAWLCGICLGSVGLALHHMLCHIWAAASTCRIRKHTPSFCRTLLLTMRSPCLLQWHALRMLLGQPMRRRACSIWHNRLGRQRLFGKLGCRKAVLTARRTLRPHQHIGIRARSSPRRFELCWTTRSTADHRVQAEIARARTFPTTTRSRSS
jgi:hypothetical protein